MRERKGKFTINTDSFRGGEPFLDVAIVVTPPGNLNTENERKIKEN